MTADWLTGTGNAVATATVLATGLATRGLATTRAGNGSTGNEMQARYDGTDKGRCVARLDDMRLR